MRATQSQTIGLSTVPHLPMSEPPVAVELKGKMRGAKSLAIVCFVLFVVFTGGAIVKKEDYTWCAALSTLAVLTGLTAILASVFWVHWRREVQRVYPDVVF